MAEFAYVAIDSAGRERRGTVTAVGPQEARARIEARRYYVARLEPRLPSTAADTAAAGSSTLLAWHPRRARRLTARQLSLFTRQLATLVQVSPLEEALRTITRQAEQPRLRAVLSQVHGAVVEGRRLSDAMTREAQSFPALYRAMVAAGEASGTLPSILERLADLLERQAKTRSKVLTALAYPIVLAAVAMLVVIAMMVFVVPRVVEQFDTVGQQLPLLTRIVIALSNLLAHGWWAMALALAAVILLAARALRNPALRLSLDRRLLALPFLGRLMRDLHAARMARTLATMVASRLPLLDGIQLTTRTIRNHALRAASADIAEAIRGGGSLSAALRRAGVFPPLLVYLVASGEASGRLDAMLERAADYLEGEFDAVVATALSLLEPAIIVVMGGIVALIVLSILLPILQLDTLAGA